MNKKTVIFGKNLYPFFTKEILEKLKSNLIRENLTFDWYFGSQEGIQISYPDNLEVLNESGTLKLMSGKTKSTVLSIVENFDELEIIFNELDNITIKLLENYE